MNLHHTLYRKLTVLIPTLPQVPEYVKSQVPGFMDLNLDLLSRNDEIITVALSHYYEQNVPRHVYLPGGLPRRELGRSEGQEGVERVLVTVADESH
jgi:hypothetical protein